jgi:hypothetical protein
MSEKSTEMDASAVATPVDESVAPVKVRRKRWQKREKKNRQGRSAREVFYKQQVWVSRVLFFLLAAFIVFPFVILLHRVFSVTGWVVPAIAGLVVTSGLFFLLRKVKFTIWTIIGLAFITVGITTVLGKYSFKDIVYDYSGFLYNISNEKKSLKDVFLQRPFPKYRQFLKASRFTPAVRQYSVTAATKNFTKYQKGNGSQYVQYFSLYKEVNSKWKYVSDPVNRDYIAPAEESLSTFCGDCDDYSVLMAACISSIGGTMRLVRTETHVYPELKIENKEDFNMVKSLICDKLFSKTARNKKIYYHEDGYGDLWINLDYTDHYPGAKFLTDEVLSVLEIP